MENLQNGHIYSLSWSYLVDSAIGAVADDGHLFIRGVLFWGVQHTGQSRPSHHSRAAGHRLGHTWKKATAQTAMNGRITFARRQLTVPTLDLPVHTLQSGRLTMSIQVAVSRFPQTTSICSTWAGFSMTNNLFCDQQVINLQFTAHSSLIDIHIN